MFNNANYLANTFAKNSQIMIVRLLFGPVRKLTNVLVARNEVHNEPFRQFNSK